MSGTNIINLKKTWEKIVLAARAIAAVENPADVFVVASRYELYTYNVRFESFHLGFIKIYVWGDLNPLYNYT